MLHCFCPRLSQTNEVGAPGVLWPRVPIWCCEERTLFVRGSFVCVLLLFFLRGRWWLKRLPGNQQMNNCVSAQSSILLLWGASVSPSIMKDFVDKLLTLCLRHKAPVRLQWELRKLSTDNCTHACRVYNSSGTDGPQIKMNPCIRWYLSFFSVCKISFF